MPRLVGINHVAVEVDDIDEALDFLAGSSSSRFAAEAPRMAFVDMGDQFIALAAGRTQPADTHRHVGLVVDDREATLAAAAAAGAELAGDNDFLDPSGNRWQIVDYRDIQFTKAPRILEGMGLSDLGKSDRALAELRAKGLAD